MGITLHGVVGGWHPYLVLARDLASTVKRGCGQMVLYVVLEFWQTGTYSPRYRQLNRITFKLWPCWVARGNCDSGSWGYDSALMTETSSDRFYWRSVQKVCHRLAELTRPNPWWANWQSTAGLQISFSDDSDPDEGESYGLSTEMRRERELMGDYGFVCDRWMALSGCPMDHMIGNFQLKFGLKRSLWGFCFFWTDSETLHKFGETSHTRCDEWSLPTIGSYNSCLPKLMVTW